MLGYCVSCQKLTAIRPRRDFTGYQLDYYPHPHDLPSDHPKAPGLCDGDKKPIR